MNMITSFNNEYDFLSNFYWCWMFGEWSTVEHWFQAKKCKTIEDMMTVLQAKSPGKAKRLGRQVEMIDSWETIKDGIMTDLLRVKFKENPYLGEKLVATYPDELVEGNLHGDQYWGQSPLGNGQNKLGKALMIIRLELM